MEAPGRPYIREIRQDLALQKIGPRAILISPFAEIIGPILDMKIS